MHARAPNHSPHGCAVGAASVGGFSRTHGHTPAPPPTHTQTHAHLMVAPFEPPVLVALS
jgi:hypothetical protein